MQMPVLRTLLACACLAGGASAFSAPALPVRQQAPAHARGRAAVGASQALCLAGGRPAWSLRSPLGARPALQLASPGPARISGGRLVGGSSLWLPGVEAGMGGGGGGIVRRSGGGGGGGGDEGDENEEGSIAALLKQYGLVASQLPKGAEALDAKTLKRFLEAYSNKLNRWLVDLWPAWRDKVLADPEFAYKLFLEETLGLGLAISGTVLARGKDLLKELDFFFTDCAVGAVLNFVIIWLLAPSVARSAATTGFSAAVSKLPAFVLEEGKYSLAQRVGAGLYKGSLFSACGFMGSLGGTTLAYMLFQLRKLANPKQTEDRPLPNVLVNSCGWASFMFVSTNTRYQLLNGFEQVMYKVVPTNVGKVGSLVIRTGNNVIGGSTWVLWARFIGLQKAQEEDAKGKGKKAKKGDKGKGKGKK